jgi:hypothetical protein
VSRRAKGEQGFVIVWFALFLGVMIAMAGFGVDLGSWYVRSTQLQRAADAGALAGVVWMPGNFSRAQTIALDVAKRNGIDPATNPKVAVSISSDPSSTRRLVVSITDTAVRPIFTTMFLSTQRQTRTATAEYLLPIPMGSPENSFGTGDLDLGLGVKSHLWGSVNGFCTAQEDGDKLLSRYDGIRTGGGYSCPYPAAPSGNAITSSDYDANGYFYDVKIPTLNATNLNFDVYDPAYQATPTCTGGGTSPDLKLVNGGAFSTNYKVFYSPMPLDHAQDQLVAGPLRFAANDAASCAKWQTLWTYRTAFDQAGLYRIQVYSTANEGSMAVGSNQFGLRVGDALGWVRCTTLTSSTCPQVHGESAISVFASESAATATFYLAQVDAIHAGKEMDVELFDPGEGASSLQILDPSGGPVNFSYDTTDSKPGFTAYSGSGTSLDVSGTISPPPGYASTSKYSDRHVMLKVTIPSNYGVGGLLNNGWWQIKYTTGAGSVSDRTTWSASILGNPVHLVK